MRRKINYRAFLLFVMSMGFIGCNEDDPINSSNSNCKIKSIERIYKGYSNSHIETLDYQYDDTGFLIKLTKSLTANPTIITFEYNADSLVTKMDYNYHYPDYIWKYTGGVLSEIEVHENNAKRFSYFFTFDNLQRLTRITSDNPSENEYIDYRWEYNGSSQNPSKRNLYRIITNEEVFPDFLIGEEVLVTYLEYEYDDKKNPDAVLKGFQVSPETIEDITYNPIPILENNIIEITDFFWEYNPDAEVIYHSLGGVATITYEYNSEGFPLEGKVYVGYPDYIRAVSFTYQECE
jgi:hypothetical protein